MARRNQRQLDLALDTMAERFGSAKADYSATKKNRFNPRRVNVPSQGGSGDYHLRNETDFYSLVEDCYDLERNDSVVGQLNNRVVTNIIQDGFRLEPDTGDRSLDRDLKDRWLAWAEDEKQCDIACEKTFNDYEYSAKWTEILAGDCGVSMCDSGHMQFFEPYLIRNDRFRANDDTFLGVDQTEDRLRYRYWIASDDPGDPYETSWNDFTPVDTFDDNGIRQFFHIYDERRTTLTRGVSCYAPIFEITGMLEDVNFAKLVQQQIVSCITYLIEEGTVQDGNNPPSTGPNFGNQSTATTDNGTRHLDELEPGAQVKSGPGNKISGFSPNVPNPEYFEQYRLLLQLICGALDLPFATGMMDGRDSTFHGFIGAGNEAKKLWRRSQRRFSRRFHRPAYLAKQNHFCDEDRCLARAARRLGRRFEKHNWHTPVWSSVQPLQDTNDRLMRLQNAMTSPSKLQNELGVDYESHVLETVNDNAFAIRVAKRKAAAINAEFDDNQPCHWRELYPLANAEGVQTNMVIETDPEKVENGSRKADKIPPKGGNTNEKLNGRFSLAN